MDTAASPATTAASPTVREMAVPRLRVTYSAGWLAWATLVLGACAACAACAACQNGTTENPAVVGAADAQWAAPSEPCGGGSCLRERRADAQGRAMAATAATPTRSLWPFFRDLDLLRLLEDAASGPSPAPADPRMTQCRADLQLYLQGLRNFSTWAVQMWDASVRAPRGAMWGELWQMGSFDECLAAPLPREPRAPPGPAFCLATLSIQAANPEREQRELQGSAWDAIKPPQSRLQVSRQRTHWGVCVPSRCGPRELSALLNGPLGALAAPHGLAAALHVDARLWQDRRGPSAEAETAADLHSAAWAVLAWLVAWVLLCTAVEAAGGPGCATRTARAFSLRRNWRALWTNGGQPAALEERDDIALIHAARVLGVAVVVVGHRGEALMASPVINANDIEKMYSNLFDIFLLNGSVIVDVFFVVGGCLLSWTVLGCMQRGKRLSLVTLYVYRYIRLVPAYAATIAFLALGLPALGSGPLWGATVLEEAHRCRQRWWTNLLFVNNFVRQDEPCLDPSWYLACDTQLFTLAAPLVLLMHSHPRLAQRLLGLALAVGVVYPAAVTWRLDLDGTLIPTPDTLGRMATTPAHMYVYVSSASRAGPYFLGVAAGWYLRRTRAQPVHQAFYWCVLPLAMLSVAMVLAGAAFYPPLASATPRWVHVAYAGLHRIVCALAMAAAVVVAASQQASGERFWTSSWNAFRPLSRLSYCVYLTHALVQLHSLGQQRAPAVYSTADMIAQSVPDLAFALLAALVLHLTVEAPCNALIHAFKRPPQKTTATNS